MKQLLRYKISIQYNVKCKNWSVMREQIEELLTKEYGWFDPKKVDKLLDLYNVSYCDCEDSHKITMTTRKCVACKKLVNE